MATKTAKTRNPDRRGSGKAWSKNHDAPVKVLSPEAQERKALKDAERARRATPRTERGSNVTMPRITWEWCAETMSGRHVGSRRYRAVEEILNRQRRGFVYESTPAAIEPNPEAKPVKSARKNGR